MKSRQAKVGAAPGTMVHVGEQMAEKTSLRVVTYTAAEVRTGSPAFWNCTFPETASA